MDAVQPKSRDTGCFFSLAIFSTERKHKLQPTRGTVSWNSQSMYVYFNGLRCYILQFSYLPELNSQADVKKKQIQSSSDNRWEYLGEHSREEIPGPGGRK